MPHRFQGLWADCQAPRVNHLQCVWSNPLPLQLQSASSCSLGLLTSSEVCERYTGLLKVGREPQRPSEVRTHRVGTAARGWGNPIPTQMHEPGGTRLWQAACRLWESSGNSYSNCPENAFLVFNCHEIQALVGDFSY